MTSRTIAIAWSTCLLALVAAAAPAKSACPESPNSDEVCTFTGTSFGGDDGVLLPLDSRINRDDCDISALEGTYFHPRCFPPHVADNATQSVRVGTNVKLRLCFNPNLTGPCLDVAPGSEIPDLGGFKNQVSSVRVDPIEADCKRNDIGDWTNPAFPQQVGLYDLFDQDGGGDCTTRWRLGHEYSNAGLMGLADNTASSVMLAPCAQLIITRDPNQGGVKAIINNESRSLPAPVNLDATPVGSNQASSMEIGVNASCHD
jgi:hypothetical protein